MSIKEFHSRFIAVHASAAFLMILGTRELFMLLYAEFGDWIGAGSQENAVAAHLLRNPDAPLVQVPEVYSHGLAVGGLLGLVLAILLSSIEARKRELHKLNVLLVGLVGFILAKAITETFFHFHHIVPSLHEVTGVIGVNKGYLLNAVLLFSTAFLLVWRKGFHRNIKSL